MYVHFDGNRYSKGDYGNNMAIDEKYYGYAGIRKDEKGRIVGLSISGDLAQVKTMAAQTEQSESPELTERSVNLIEKDSGLSLGATINRVVDVLQSQFELLSITTVLQSFSSSFLLKEEILKPLEEADCVVESYDCTTIFGLSQNTYRQIAPKFERLQRLDRGLEALPAALLMSIVATFDSNMADIVRDMLTIKSDLSQTGSKTILLSDVLQSNSIAEVKEKFINDEVYLFSRGSHEEQVDFIEKSFHVSIKSHWKRWPDFIEIFERRNLLAHGEKRFTKRYIEISKKHGHKGSEKLLNTSIKLTPSYLSQSVNVLLEFSVLLVFSLWRKQFPEQEARAFANINDVSFKLISNKRYKVSICILEYILSLKNTKAPDDTRRMMVVNLASAFRHAGEFKRCVDTLEAIDWSASADNYKICVASLKDDLDEVVRLMPMVIHSGSIKKEDFRHWPVFSFMQDNEKFCSKFSEIFGESIRNEKQPQPMISSDEKDASLNEVEAPETIH